AEKFLPLPEHPLTLKALDFTDLIKGNFAVMISRQRGHPFPAPASEAGDGASMLRTQSISGFIRIHQSPGNVCQLVGPAGV
ncbi:MAG TPA: hypothetical protein PLD30_04085, partial [Candidatus Competibacteraceae bacterium]|nr:hypothetical protein [Candidatus Competibacteraceae bacterium]